MTRPTLPSLAAVLLTASIVATACPPAVPVDAAEGEGEGEGEGEAGEGEGEGDPEPDVNDPNNPNRDSDCDGLSDAEEFGTVYPGDRRTDPGDADSDDDGVPDGAEVGRTTSVEARCDGRLVPDGDPSSVTDPTGPDTDADGLCDGPDDVPGVCAAGEDLDGDGQLDRNVETDPNNPDSDGDGLCDGENDVPPVCTGGDDEPVPVSPDADEDGLPDAVDPVPNDPDADDDGLCDGAVDVPGVCVAGEDLDGDGFVDDGESDPLQVDTDCDGVDDIDEGDLGTNPSNADTDGDGVLDGVEAGAGPRGALGDCPAFPGDADPTSTTSPTDPDSDGDGVPDGAEDPNQNGGVDDGELDPSDPGDGNDPTVQAACALDALVPLAARTVLEADIQVVVPQRDPNAFADEVILRDGAGVPVGVAGHDATHRVAFVAVNVDPAGADALADEAALQSLLDGSGNVTNALTRTFTTWDGYEAVHGSYTLQANAGTKQRANGIIGALLGAGAGALSESDDPPSTQGFRVEAEVVRRSDQTTIVLVALTPGELFDGPSGFLARDLGDGSALGQAADSTGVQCDRLLSEGTGQLDVLWAVDNSASMGDEQAAVATAADVMADRLAGAGIEFRAAAVTSGFYKPPNNAGCTNTACAEVTGNQCRAFTTDLAVMQNWFEAPVGGNPADAAWLGAGNNSNGFSCNVAIEAYIRGAQLVLSDPPVGGAATFLPAQANPDAQHIRDGGNLLVMFVGDVDDQFPDPAAADTTVTVDDYEAFFRALPLASVQMGGILCPVGQTCGENRFRNPRVDHGLINRFGGIIGSIRDTASIPDNVNAIVDAAIVNVSPYVLTDDPITATVKVAMDAGTTVGPCDTSDVPRSRESGFDVDPTTRAVAFFGDCRPDPAQTGSLIAISYRTWIDQSPEPDPPLPACSICGSCTGVERCDLDACACVCDAELSCREGFAWDAELCGCVCDAASLACEATHAPDEDLCACLCQPDCGGACDPATEVCQDSTCACVPILGG